MQNLKAQIESLAQQFALGVLSALRSAPLEELVSETARRAQAAPPRAKRGATPARGGGGRAAAGRRGRRSSADIDATIASIVSAVKGAAGGMRAEEIRARLGVDRKELPLALKRAVETKQLKKKGQKRATTYFA